MAWFGNRLRTPEFARRRRRVFALKVALALFTALTSVYGIVYTLRHEALQVRTVVVSGAEVLDARELQAVTRALLSGTYFYIIPKSSALLRPRRSLEAAVLHAFPRLKSAEVTTENVSTVVLSVSEREPRALWCGENHLERASTPACYFMDSEGYVFAEAPEFTGLVYTRYFGALGRGEPIVGQYFLSGTKFSELTKFTDALAREGVELADVALTDRDVELYLTGGTVILFSQSQELNRVLDNLLSVISAEEFKNRERFNLDYLDLRYGNKVYYKEREVMGPRE